MSPNLQLNKDLYVEDLSLQSIPVCLQVEYAVVLTRSPRRRIWMWFGESGNIQQPILKKWLGDSLPWKKDRCSLGKKTRVGDSPEASLPPETLCQVLWLLYIFLHHLVLPKIFKGIKDDVSVGVTVQSQFL